MAAAVARNSSLLRALWRTTNSRGMASPILPSSIRSNFMSQHSRISARSPLRLRRESLLLSSLLPDHSAIASACLVSKLPSEASTSTEGRFANYLSPI
ncbi:PREDICTED: uncharacterized protein LOC104587748 [Nelumbo nucifera]|uniref:Uncharacterized protein LOC104587748 n=2 Tax=Nelumbo nucifera TaxID=4432 RepID=A0A1U7Z821_NELNU|nr:PREDICTED: uncharacterized protein LOC104587748 [Nelumbo nucifera]DAD48651.1 TPA_asm: hypothetical protein HUJ06_018588 [Nelumbo nucifera]